MERIQIGRLRGHQDVSFEYDINSETTPTSVVERYVCRTCGTTAGSQEDLDETACEQVSELS